jgi:hypothetical protein
MKAVGFVLGALLLGMSAFPLSLALAPFDLAARGVTAKAARGSIWLGSLEDAAWRGQRLGTLLVSLSPRSVLTLTPTLILENDQMAARVTTKGLTIIRAPKPSAPAITARQQPTPAVPPPDPARVRIHALLGGAAGGAAILSVDQGAQRRVAVGAMVMDGVQLATIGTDHIILRSNGGDARLEFAPSINAPGSIHTRAPDQTAVPFQAALTAVRRDQTIVGYRVGTNHQIALFDAAGVRPGDVITHVNGQPLNSEENIQDLSVDLTLEPMLTLGVLRDGRVLSLTTPTR